jgi:hypothetical protein
LKKSNGQVGLPDNIRSTRLRAVSAILKSSSIPEGVKTKNPVSDFIFIPVVVSYSHATSHQYVRFKRSIGKSAKTRKKRFNLYGFCLQKNPETNKQEKNK